MTWSYLATQADSATAALQQIQSKVDNTPVGYCGKFAASNEGGVVSLGLGRDIARAVFFYSNQSISQPNIQPYNTQWEMQNFSSDTDYNSLYQDTVEALAKLTSYQQFYASIMFTNASEKMATMTISYPLSEG